MTTRAKIAVLAVVAILILGAATAYGVSAFVRYQERQAAPSEVETTPFATSDTSPRIVFRNTAAGDGYGLVASVPLADPAGARQVTDIACDRVAATASDAMCLRIDRGIVTTYEAVLYDAAWQEQRSWPLPGIPSRTRISPDADLVATTAFVTGHSYATIGFSTETVVSRRDGTSFGNLEDFALTIDGRRVTAADRNIWGVTFTDDDNTFYATAGTAGRTWLVRGDLAERTLTSVHADVECPSLSPDGTRIAYKQNLSTSGTPHWVVAVLELATGKTTTLSETRNVDDQVTWLDDTTILYGLPRDDAVGDTDVWAVQADGGGEPTVYIEHAWSPTIVR